MKSLLNHLLVFTTVALLATSFGCGGPAANIDLANGNSATPAVNSSAKPSDYPPLASGIANAEFTQIDGTKFKVTDKKGKVVLLNLWGTWCGPCRAEMPTLIKLQDQYRDQGLEIVGINVGNGEGEPEPNELITGFVEKMKLNYTVTQSHPELTKEFYRITRLEVVPQTLLVDREGRLRAAFAGGGPKITVGIEDAVDKLMKEQ